MNQILLTTDQEKVLLSSANTYADGEKKTYFVPFVFARSDDMPLGAYEVIHINETGCKVPGFLQYRNEENGTILLVSNKL